MKNKIFALFFIPCSFLPALAEEPTNINTCKKQSIEYYDSGKYQRDIERVVNRAIKYLESQLPHRLPGKKSAIVLDIDDTSLSNYKSILRLNFGGNLKLWKKIILKADSEAIIPTLTLFNVAKNNGIAVIFITGRLEEEDLRAATIKNLKKVGYEGWDKLILKPKDFFHEPAWKYKSAIRKRLMEEYDYDIIINVGDQESDLIGGSYARRSFKLPNPFYFTP